jgi:hypothetical protein
MSLQSQVIDLVLDSFAEKSITGDHALEPIEMQVNQSGNRLWVLVRSEAKKDEDDVEVLIFCGLILDSNNFELIPEKKLSSFKDDGELLTCPEKFLDMSSEWVKNQEWRSAVGYAHFSHSFKTTVVWDRKNGKKGGRDD